MEGVERDEPWNYVKIANALQPSCVRFVRLIVGVLNIGRMLPHYLAVVRVSLGIPKMPRALLGLSG
jgi:hypothetical protein